MKKSSKRFCLLIIVGCFFLVTLAAAQEPAAKAPVRVIVHAGKLLDVRSGKTLTDQAIVIEAGKIIAVAQGILADTKRLAAAEADIRRAELRCRAG